MSIRIHSMAARRLHKCVSEVLIETLECRQLLSGVSPLTLAQVNPPITGAYTPAQIRNAYGVSALSLANQGQGITIGIVDELNDPDISSDANAFSAEYNLPKLDGVGGDPLLTVYEDTALGSVGSASGTGVAAETCLDVEWAHAVAPMANILLVEVPATGNLASSFNELLHGVQVAAQKGAVSISLSYGSSESSIGDSTVASQNSTYLSSGAAAGVAVSASAGDGSSPLFPATSPNVTAVGGTSLYLASVKGTYSFETAWGGLAGAGAGGGGLSAEFTAPAFQSANGIAQSKRAVPDVALVADAVTGVSIYDTLDAGGGTPWTEEGGTSVACPIFAGIIALAQQNRVSASLPVLNSVQIDQEMYSLYNSPSYTTYFHDITQGSNKDVSSSGKTSVTGYSATTGYDLATGLGSPIASTLVPALSTVNAASLSVQVSSPTLSVTFGGAFSGVIPIVPVARVAPVAPLFDAISSFRVNTAALPVISPAVPAAAPMQLSAPLPIILATDPNQPGMIASPGNSVESLIGDALNSIVLLGN